MPKAVWMKKVINWMRLFGLNNKFKAQANKVICWHQIGEPASTSLKILLQNAIFFKNRWSLLIAGESVDVNQMINPIWIIYFRKNEKSQIFNIIRISNYSSSI